MLLIFADEKRLKNETRATHKGNKKPGHHAGDLVPKATP